MSQGKRYLVKIYNPYRTPEFITTIEDVQFSGFSHSKNQAAGEASVVIPGTIEDYGEGFIVEHGNRYDVFVLDREAPGGVLIYQGEVSSYRESESPGESSFEVRLTSYGSMLSRYLVGSGDNLYVKTRASGDALQETGSIAEARAISDVVSFLFTELATKADPNLLVNGGVTTTTDTITATYSGETYLKVLQDCLSFAPADFFWAVDPDSTFRFQEKPTSATHFLSRGKSFRRYESEKEALTVANRVVFNNGSTEPRLNILVEDAESQARYGIHTLTVTDGRVQSFALGKQRAESELARNKDPKIRIQLTVLDSNIEDDLGYDIESFRVGHTVRIEGLPETYAGSSLDNLEITSIRYSRNECTLELEEVPWNQSRRFVEVEDRVSLIEKSGSAPRFQRDEFGYTTTLTSPWVQGRNPSSSDFVGARYTKNGAGVVRLWGLVNSGVTSVSTNSTIFTLPPSFRPSGRLIFQCAASVAGVFRPVRIDVQPTGEVQYINKLNPSDGASPNGVIGYVDLSTVKFLSQDSSIRRRYALENSWVDYGSGYEGASMFEFEGITYLQGLVTAGTNNGIITNLDDSLRTKVRGLLLVPWGGTSAGVAVGVTRLNTNDNLAGSVLTSANAPVGGTGLNNWVSFSGSHFPQREPSYMTAPTLNAGYSDPFGTGWGPIMYGLNPDGFVHLQGLVRKATTGGVAFTLPIGFRPKQNHVFCAAYSQTGNVAPGSIEVKKNGDVEIGVAADWASLWGISFPIE